MLATLLMCLAMHVSPASFTTLQTFNADTATLTQENQNLLLDVNEVGAKACDQTENWILTGQFDRQKNIPSASSALGLLHEYILVNKIVRS